VRKCERFSSLESVLRIFFASVEEKSQESENVELQDEVVTLEAGILVLIIT